MQVGVIALKGNFVVVGRKRKPGKRWKNGNLITARSLDPKVIAAAMPHRQDVPADVRHDPKALTAFGRLNLKGTITDAQYDAGVRWRDVVSLYQSSIDAPRKDAPSLSGALLGITGGSYMTDDEARRRRDRYMETYEALEDGAGHIAARAVSRWCVYDEDDRPTVDLIRGLNVLAEHFGLTRNRKSPKRGNAG